MSLIVVPDSPRQHLALVAFKVDERRVVQKRATDRVIRKHGNVVYETAQYNMIRKNVCEQIRVSGDVRRDILDWERGDASDRGS
jgi:hypothetical protein